MALRFNGHYVYCMKHIYSIHICNNLVSFNAKPNLRWLFAVDLVCAFFCERIEDEAPPLRIYATNYTCP